MKVINTQAEESESEPELEPELGESTKEEEEIAEDAEPVEETYV